MLIFDAGAWNGTSVVINIQFPLPNDIDNVKLYCIPWYVDFEARTNMAARLITHMFSAGLVSLVYTACHDEYALQEISVTPYTRTVL